MAKITAYVPEPSPEYDVSNQRQILESINTIKDQLNFSFQKGVIKYFKLKNNFIQYLNNQ